MIETHNVKRGGRKRAWVAGRGVGWVSSEEERESENNTWYCLVYTAGEGETKTRDGEGESTVHCTVAAALEVVKKNSLIDG